VKRPLILLAAAAVTAVLASLALMLGDIGFETRRFSLHEGRLQRLLALQPRADQVTDALAGENARLLGVAQDGASAAALARRYGGARQAEIEAKAARWPQLRVFLAADMIYFIYFDPAGVMKDFTLVTGGQAR
jgi:hypothetical protein